jgi:hypothetical protein
VTCAVNGAGSITLQPGTGFVLSASNGADRLSMPSAWNVIASSGGSTYTVIDGMTTMSATPPPDVQAAAVAHSWLK